MDTAGYTIWLAGQVGSAVGYLWFISLPLILFATATFFWLLARRAGFTAGARMAFWLCLAFPVLMLAFGGMFREQSDHTSAVIWFPSVALAFLFGLFVASIRLAPGQRLATLSFVLLGSWLGLLASFVALMSVSGDWL